MKQILVLIISIVIILNVVHADRVRRFVGGRNARQGQFPYMVSLRNLHDGEHFCGGSIIHKDFILTAAHCLENTTHKDFYVLAGTIVRPVPEKGQIYLVEKLAKHVHFNHINVTDDIAIIKLKNSFKFSNQIQKISLNYKEPPVGEIMTITGWGFQRDNSVSYSSRLQYSNVTSISLNECRKRIRTVVYNHCITKRLMCTYDRPRLGICNGDSGGPLAHKGKQVGIVSWAIGCARGFPDVYVKVSSYSKWIKFTMKKLKRNKIHFRSLFNFPLSKSLELS